jgi:hypothetical protein
LGGRETLPPVSLVKEGFFNHRGVAGNNFNFFVISYAAQAPQRVKAQAWQASTFRILPVGSADCSAAKNSMRQIQVSATFQNLQAHQLQFSRLCRDDIRPAAKPVFAEMPSQYFQRLLQHTRLYPCADG